MGTSDKIPQPSVFSGDYVSMEMLLDAGAAMTTMTPNIDRTPIMEIIDNDDVTG